MTLNSLKKFMTKYRKFLQDSCISCFHQLLYFIEKIVKGILPVTIKKISPCIFLLYFTFHGCGADPDLAEAPGTCKLDCSKPKIPANGSRVRFLSKDIQVSCNNIAGQSHSAVMPVKFVFEKYSKTAFTPSSSAAPAGAAGAATPSSSEPVFSDDPSVTPAPVDGYQIVPIPGISFNVQITGGFAPPSTVNPADARTFYQGILTDSEQWCSDSCGVGSIDFVPFCEAAKDGTVTANKTTLRVTSGSISAEVSITTDQ